MTTEKKTVARKATTAKGRATQAKTAAAANSKAKHTGTITALIPIAKEINVRFTKAAKLDGQADDHRLAAAIKLAEAKAKCEADKLNFKKWAEENVKQSYETVRKLVPVGEADDPKLALEDMRGKNKQANKKLRDKTKAEKVSRETDAPAAKTTPLDRIEGGLAALDDQARMNILESAVAKEGFAVVTKENAQRALGLAKTKSSLLVQMKKDFDHLPGADKMDLLEYIADAVGATVEVPFVENDADEQIDLELPAALKR